MTIWIKCTEKQFKKLHTVPKKGILSSVTIPIDEKTFDYINEKNKRPVSVENREKIGIVVNNKQALMGEKIIPEYAELIRESEYTKPFIKVYRTLTKAEVIERRLARRKKMSNG